jgi:DNA-directed RNA polymerase subunit omega
MLPSPDILNEFEHGKFVLSNLAAKRAKQLREGAPPLVNVESTHPLTIALAEIAAGKIKPVMPTGDLPLADGETAALVDETVPAELGMLLPALDESEAALIGTPIIGDEEGDSDVEHEEPDTLSLSDLVGEEEEEEEEEVAASDEDTLSLTDIAAQESEEEEATEE